MKKLIILIFLPLFFLACADDDQAPTDALEAHGLLGQWELINAYEYEVGSSVIIDDLLVDLGSVRFEANAEPADLSGRFVKERFGTTAGDFTLNPTDSTILFSFDGKEFLFGYHIEEDWLRLSQQSGTTVLVEDYVRD